MSTLSNVFIIGLVAVVSTTPASAQEMQVTYFRYDKTLSTEHNYSNFEKTARRVCGRISILADFGVRKNCRNDLMNQAVAATKQGPMIAYHDQMIDKDRQTAALIKR